MPTFQDHCRPTEIAMENENRLKTKAHVFLKSVAKEHTVSLILNLFQVFSCSSKVKINKRNSKIASI